MKLFYYFLISGLLLVSAQLSAQLNIPNLPLERAENMLTESPLSLQLSDLTGDSIQITGYFLQKDPVSSLIQDTVLKVEQSTLIDGVNRVFEEKTSEKNPAGAWHPRNRVLIRQKQDDSGVNPLWPESVFIYNWNGQSFTQEKKIIYQQPAPDTLFRRVYLSTHAVADTIEKIYVDTTALKTIRVVWAWRAVENDYRLQDSATYLFIDNQCRGAGRFQCSDGVCKLYSRWVFQYASDPGSFTRQEDLFIDSLGFWKGRYKYGTQVSQQEFKILQQFDTLTNIAWQTYKRIIAQYDNQWRPLQIDIEFYPQHNGLPEYSTRKEYIKNGGIISEIIHYTRAYQDDWIAAGKWMFAEGTSVSTRQPDKMRAPEIFMRELKPGLFEFRVEENPDAEFLLNLFDSNGKLLRSIPAQMQHEPFLLDVTTYPAGVYYAAFSSVLVRKYRTFPVVKSY